MSGFEEQARNYRDIQDIKLFRSLFIIIARNAIIGGPSLRHWPRDHNYLYQALEDVQL
jgi:uncharacterized protein YfaT (DUF1175 family)